MSLRFLVASVLGALWAVAALGRPLKVITFNAGLVCVGPRCLLAGEPTGDRAAEVGRWIRAQGADLVFLQEVFREKDFAVIQAESGMPHGAFASSHSALALLSLHPIREKAFDAFRWQGSTERDCKRLTARLLTGIQTAVVAPPGSPEIVVANTHPLSRNRDLAGFDEPADAITPQRKINILEMWQRVKKLDRKAPVIFGGDFNMNQRSDEYVYFREITGLKDVLRARWEAEGRDWKGACTFCAGNPRVQAQGDAEEGILDHLWISGGDLTVSAAAIHSDTDPISDHRAVSAVLELPARAPLGELAGKLPEVTGLISHVEGVSIHPFCWLAIPWGWSERNLTVRFLQGL